MQSIYRFLVVSLVAFAMPSLACRCMPKTWNETLTQPESLVFRGTVTKVEPAADDFSQNKYIVQLGRVFKGCNIKGNERVLMTSYTDSATCGVVLALGASYLFSTGPTQPIDNTTRVGLGPRTKITQTVWASSCKYNQEWSDVPAEVLATLRSYQNQKMCQAPKTCKTGADCPIKNSFCDSGKCMAIGAPCPSDRPQTSCVAEPCAVATPCSVEGSKCYNDYCGGCNAIFFDPNKMTRVCHV